MKKAKFETDCRIPFQIEWLFRRGSIKSCGLLLQSGQTISYFPIPDGIRYGFAPIIRYLKSDIGQSEIEKYIKSK